MSDSRLQLSMSLDGFLAEPPPADAELLLQRLVAGEVDELEIRLVPAFLGGGVRLFDCWALAGTRLECTGAEWSPASTRLSFRVLG